MHCEPGGGAGRSREGGGNRIMPNGLCQEAGT